MLNLSKKEHVQKLADQVKDSATDLQKFVNVRDKCWALYLGNRWHRQRWEMMERTPVPFMQQAIDLYVQHLSGVRPQPLVLTRQDYNLPLAKKLEYAQGIHMEEINFARMHRMTVKESLMGMPLVKVWSQEVRSSRLHSKRIGRDDKPPILAFSDTVNTPNVVIDFGAESPDQIGFIGNRYRIPLEWVKKNAGVGKLYRKADVNKLSPISRSGPSASPSRQRRSMATSEPLYEEAEFVDLYLPWEDRFVTIPAPEHHEADFALADDRWVGPSGGPYVMPWLLENADDIRPLPPAWSWIDIHMSINSLYVKLIEQAEDMKQVIGAQGNAVRDAERVQKARNGEIWRLDHPQNVQEFRFQGPDQPVMSFAIHLRSLGSWSAGNLDLLGGFMAQSGTATQDQLLHSQGTAGMQYKQQQVLSWTEKVLEKLAWYLLRDRHLDLATVTQVGPHRIPGRLMASDLLGRKNGFEFRVEPYSLKFTTPMERLNMLFTVTERILDRYGQMVQNQGNTVDVGELLDLAGRYSGIHELSRVIKRADRQVAPEGAAEVGSGSPREYLRISKSGGNNPQEALNELPGVDAQAVA